MLVYKTGEVVLSLPSFVSSLQERMILEKYQNWLYDHFKDQKDPHNSRLDRRKDYLEKKEVARRMIREGVEHFNHFYGLSVKRIAVRDQRTRWGSCSQKGNLNFNYRLIYLPKNLFDYIIVHELCHLQEMNHSPKFWELVAKTIPDHKQRRRELKKYSI